MPLRPSGKRAGERGHASVLALVFVTVVVGMSVVWLEALPVAIRDTGERVDRQEAYYWSHGAAALARLDLRNGGDGNLAGNYATDTHGTWSPPTGNPGGNGKGGDAYIQPTDAIAAELDDDPHGAYIVRTTEVEYGTYLVEAFARSGDVIDGIVQVVDVEWTIPDFTEGIFADGGVDTTAYLFSDSYDSSAGSYASQATNSHNPLLLPLLGPSIPYAGAAAKIASNQSIALSTGYVFGNATPGPPGTFTGATYVSGSTMPASEQRAVAPVDYDLPSGDDNAAISSLLGANDDLVVSGSSVETIGAGTYVIGALSTADLAELRFTGDTVLYVQDALSISDSSKIVVEAGASLTIYVAEGVTIGGLGFQNETGSGGEGSPANLRVVMGRPAGSGGGPPLSLSFDTAEPFFGVVYAPDVAIVDIAQPTEVFGALLFDTLAITESLTLHYDTQTSTLPTPAPQVRVTAAWRP